MSETGKDELEFLEDMVASGAGEGDSLESFAEDVFERQQVTISLGAGAEGTQHVHTPHLKGSASLNTRSVDVPLFRLALIFKLARFASPDDAGDFRHKAEHEDALPAELIGGYDTRVT